MMKRDRKSTRLNSSHVRISYAVFCLSCDHRDLHSFPTRRSSDLFSGPGVSGSNFNPSVAGAGTHAINYEITINGCTASSTENVTVNPPPSVSFSGLNTSYCYDET